jgi:ribosome recycling factor
MPINGEARKALIKKVKEKSEEGKISLRNSRHKFLQEAKKLSQNEQEH